MRRVTGAGPGGADRHLVRAALGSALGDAAPGDAAPGDGLRLRHDLLAGIAGVAGRGRVWDRLHRVLLDRLGRAGAIDWCRVCLDSASVSAKRGREDWPEPDGPRPPRIEAADHHRRSGCAGCRQPHRCKRSQQPRLRGADRCLAARSDEGGDDPACARPSSMRTRPMTSHAAAEPYAGGTSELGLPDAAWTAANARHYGANSPNMVIE